MLRIGFIGAGRVADAHYNALMRVSDRATLAAFCEPSPDRREAREGAWSVPGHASVAALLSTTELDAVVVMVPPAQTAEVIAQVVPRVEHVLLEKPLATRREDAQLIAALADKHHTRILIGHNGLFHPAFRAVEAAVKGGRIGHILSASAESSGWLSLPDADFRRSKERTGGGVWFDTGSHLIYSLTALMGPVTETHGILRRLARTEMEGDDHALVHLAFVGGAIASLEASYARKRPAWEQDWPKGYHLSVTIWGDRGAIRYQLCPTVRTSIFSEGQGDWTDLAPPSPFQDSFDSQMAHFVECIAGQAKPRVGIQAGLDVLDCLLSVKDN